MARPRKMISTTEAADICGLSTRKFLREAELHFVLPQEMKGKSMFWWKAEIDALAVQLRREAREQAVAV